MRLSRSGANRGRSSLTLIAGASRGGVAHNVRRILIELEARGHSVERIDISVRGAPAARAIASAWRNRHRLRAADTVHVEFGSNDVEAFWFALAVCLLRRDCVVLSHDYPKVMNAPGAGLISSNSRWASRIAYRVLSPLLDRPLLYLLRRRAGVVIVFGADAQAGWRAAGAEHVELITHGSDGATTACAPPSAGESVLFAGFMGPGKGIDTLLEAWSHVGSDIGLPLVLAGEANDVWAQELESRYAGISNAPRWIGTVTEEADFHALIGRAAIVVLPYRRSSPASGILVRAMTLGRAVIATPVPAMAHALEDGVNGVLVPIDDPQRLGIAIRGLYESPERRDRLGAAAARRATELFGWDRHIADLERAYAAATRGRDARSGPDPSS